jgi:hypothetical protein
VVEERVAQAEAGYAGLTALDLGGVSTDELIRLLRAHEAMTRRAPTFDHRLLAELSERITGGEVAVRDVKTFLVEALHVSGREASARVAAAVDCGPRRTLTGPVLPALFPAVAAGQAAGVVSVEQVRLIRAAVDALPAQLQAEHAASVEVTLVAAAAQFEPRQLTRVAGRILATLYPDGPEPAEEVHQRNRWVTVRMNPDRSAQLAGRLSPPVAAQVKAVLDALSKPRADQDGPDRRSYGQRMHDALGELSARVLRSGTLPACGGIPATVLVTMTLDQLQNQVAGAVNASGRSASSGLVATAGGVDLTVPELLQIAGEAKLIPIITDAAGAVRHLGHDRRLASTEQRYALAARDGGCAFPGCTMPPHWSEAHHVVPWLIVQRTEVANLALLCPHHHHNFERWGWQLVMREGRPWWIPPDWRDPTRTPIQNTAHHRPITFDVATESTPDLPAITPNVADHKQAAMDRGDATDP